MRAAALVLFTQIEEHFRAARGTPSFLLSPCDWGLVQEWLNAGVPAEAIFRGIDRAFDDWRRGSGGRRMGTINSLAYCAQSITAEAVAMVGIGRHQRVLQLSDGKR
jgi:hypothetical protein